MAERIPGKHWKDDSLRLSSDWDADVLRRKIERQVSVLGNLPRGTLKAFCAAAW